MMQQMNLLLACGAFAQQPRPATQDRLGQVQAWWQSQLEWALMSRWRSLQHSSWAGQLVRGAQQGSIRCLAESRQTTCGALAQ
jgi:hypothetical protein